MTYFASAVGLAFLAIALLTIEMVGSPPVFLCRCSAPGFRPVHLASRWLFIAGAGCIYAACFLFLTGADSLLASVFGLGYAAVGGYNLQRWWWHTKRKRNRLLGRMLGVVKVTAAGLRVVPAPARSPAAC